MAAKKQTKQTRKPVSKVTTRKTSPESNPATHDWYYKKHRGTKEYGPFPLEELVRMVQDGKLKPNDSVKKGHRRRWEQVESCQNLRPADDPARDESSSPSVGPFVGIDFGTTKTMVAEYHPAKKHAKIHKLGRGGDEMPTSMYVSSEGVVSYGDYADDEGLHDAQSHIRCFKMLLGTGTLTKFGTKKATPTELAADFLSHIRQQLESEVFHRPVHHLVLTVPAIFGAAQREDLTRAATRAGFKEVELLHEPVAAGIAYCDHHSDLSQDLRFLVVDWGGGTFDLALVERNGANECRILNEYIDGTTDIGGEDLDDDLWEAASGMVVAAGFPALDQQPKQHWGSYRRELTRTKERLSTVDEVPARFTLDNDKFARIPIGRAKLEEVFSEKIERGARQVAELVARCRKANLAPAFILLAGGTSRIPMIARTLEKTTGLQCRSWSEGRDAIALGAAIHANRLWGVGEVPAPEEAISETPSVTSEQAIVVCPHCESKIDGTTGTGEWICPECEGEYVVACACPECGEEVDIKEWGSYSCPTRKCGAVFNAADCITISAPPPAIECPHCESEIEGVTGTGEWICLGCEGEYVVACACPECGEELDIEEWGSYSCPTRKCGAVFNAADCIAVSAPPAPPSFWTKITTTLGF